MMRTKVQFHLMVLCSILLPASVSYGQGMPVEAGAAQNPYVLILMDTSGSKQWTTEGHEQYPAYEPATMPTMSPTGGVHRHLSSWQAGDRIYYNDPTRRYTTIGPCFLWYPTCGSYIRPSRYAFGNGDGGPPWMDDYPAAMTSAILQDNYPSTSSLRGAKDTHSSPVWQFRMNDNSQKPRHVIFKEILTGDMVLMPPDFEGNVSGAVTDYDPNLYGPACWFVPRMAFTEGFHIDPPGRPPDPDAICPTDSGFLDIIDFAEPRPHIQEVYDGQLNNGLMDIFGSSVIFGTAMLDGFPHADANHAVSNWPYPMDDIVAGQSPMGTLSSEDNIWDCLSDGSNLQCYNMGIYRFISPTNFDLDQSMRIAISDYAQHAITDAGYLSLQSTAEYTFNPTTPPSWISTSFPGDLDQYVEPFTFGKQPIAAASAHSPAFHDIHQYYREGQHSVLDPSQVNNPFEDDPYNACRPKHTILITDVNPMPEHAGGAGNDVGSEAMGDTFFMNPDRFKYEITEDYIGIMVDDSTGIGYNTTNPNFQPRVHVVGMIIDHPDQPDVIEKLATMAMQGKTCAQYYLPRTLIQPGYHAGRPDGDGLTAGICDSSTDSCLVPQGMSFSFVPPDGSAPFNCDSPALIFTENDRDTIRNALQYVLNEIVNAAGLASRTRPVMTSYLDHPDNVQGQYRVYSGMQLHGNNLYWKGVLNRQMLPCEVDASGLATTEMVPLHNQINELLLDIDGTDAGFGDRRRVFTSVPYYQEYDPIAHIATPNVGEFPYISSGSLAAVNPSHDAFNLSYLRPGETPGDQITGLHGTRLDFNVLDLEAAYATHTMSAADVHSYFKVPNQPALKTLIDEVRGRMPEKEDRVLGAIFNSNPVIVPPPNLDLPMESYRQYRQLFHDRATMLYVSTLDGMLHAIYTGTPEVPARNFLTAHEDGSSISETAIGTTADNQREAWAYIPHMLHRRLQDFAGGQPRLLDGTPTVSDVRLCHPNNDHNRNSHACNPSFWGGTIPPQYQWRSVLVAGMGETGAGYFSLDVTRPGKIDGTTPFPPDPIPLWEFDRSWERGQVETISDSGNSWVIGTFDTGVHDIPASGCVNDDDFWRKSYLGASISEAAISTVAYKPDVGEDDVIHRAVAIFGGGDEVGIDDSDCGKEQRLGRALYILDLQTGSILRRIIAYYDSGGNETALPAPLVGSVALYDDTPGSMATRGFIGDKEGRLYRLDLTSPDTRDWKLTLFFDPYASTDLTLHGGDTGYGAASFRPAITRGPNQNLIVAYGLGDRGDTHTAGKTQAMIGLEEVISGGDVVANPLWIHRFDQYEKLTGEPVIFNNGVYFTSYYLPGGAVDLCQPGYSRIYGLNYLGDSDPATVAVVGVIDDSVEDTAGGVQIDQVNEPPMWFGPVLPSLIRGVSITLGPNCSYTFDPDDSTESYQDQAPRQPQLVAHVATGEGSGDAFNPHGGDPGAMGDSIGRIAVDLEPPRSQTMPMSWSVISY